MLWPPLAVAAVFGALAGLLHHRGKAPRAGAILGGLALLAVLAGIPFLLSLITHLRAQGPWLILIIVGLIASAVFFFFDVLRGDHKVSLFSRGSGGQGGGVKRHLRPQLAVFGLIVFGLAAASQWPSIMSSLSSGTGQTVTSITHSGA